MGFRAQARRLLDSIFKRYGYELVLSSSVYDWQRYPRARPGRSESPLPEGAECYLQPDNPRLEELRERYAAFDGEAMIPLIWTAGHVRAHDLQHFRGDNAYVWQLRGPNMNVMSYALTAFYVESIDRLGLWRRLEEDDCFGNVTFCIDGKTVSRDLLDSITEIYFLDKHLGISSLSGPTILDIGAGYGRLAHRMVEAFPNIKTYLCTDAVALSTFICEYYLRFRALANRAKVVPLDDVEDTVRSLPVDIALNIHSFSECSIRAIEWWLALLEKCGIRYLMIVPNALDHGGELLLTNDGRDMGEIVERHGYVLVVKEPKFGDPVVQRYAINPTCYYLFELR